MKIKYIFLLLMVSAAATASLFPQSSDRNYIRTRTYTNESGTAYLDAIQYFDGLGRLVQTVQKGITPQQNDLVTLQEYDAFGREAAQWLPAKGAGNGAYTNPATVKANAGALYGDASPFSKPVYEASPLNRVLEQYAPGSNWHSNGKSVKTAHKANTASGALACALYAVTNSGSLTKQGNYAASQLYVTETKDEEGNTSYTFTDKLGRTLLVRMINSGVNHDTYYVYNDFGNVCYVLPPLAADALSGNGTWANDSDALKKYGYVYRYDHRNRITWKRLPGCEPVEYIYDRADRLIFQRDGELKKQNLWTFSIPDHLGRTALTGTCGNTALGLTVSEAGFKNLPVKAQKRSNTAGGLHGYDILRDGTVAPTTGLTVLTVNWYDDYRFLERSELSTLGLGYDTGEGADYHTMYGATNDAVAHRGMLTGTATAMLNSNAFIYSAFYYDYRGQVIQTKSTNHLGGVEKEYVKYDFTGNALKSLHVHTVPNKPVQRELYTSAYDHAGRFTKTTHKLNSEKVETTLAENSYDEAGRLKSTSNSITGKVQYGYNVRSWLQSINSGEFAENLSYSYGGNISGMSWRNSSGTALTGSYALTYDNLSRLTEAKYTVPNSAATPPFGAYDEMFTYDKHGNILELVRYDKDRGLAAGSDPNGGILANYLTMTYNGNQLKQTVANPVNNITTSSSCFFTDWNPGTQTDYLYNANGATIRDENRGMTVDYNLLNLPELLNINNSITDGYTFYSYSVDGIKRSVSHSWAEQNIASPITGSGLQRYVMRRTDYVGNKIYVDGQLDKILLPNGYIKNDKYHFYLRDHLGNNRVVMTSILSPPLDTLGSNTNTMRLWQNIVVQRTDYYPSGLPFPNMLNPQEQPYKYNGKEFDTMHGLNMY
ncbi:MAG: DUF6443 domain-containing protein, partial [Cytophagaceae bacterium]|nr:DUF6443 domain-containing protein [Cytophagaceae bacterium]